VKGVYDQRLAQMLQTPPFYVNVKTLTPLVSVLTKVPYRLYITAQKYRFLPCGVTARTKNIYLFWGCGIEKRGFLAYFGAYQAKVPVRGWCKFNISRVRG
jgi:hypothetical protein